MKTYHFWWVVCLLGATIIFLLSFILTKRVCNASKIMEFISYSSAILSITLSVFAILYTYTSNVQMQQQFEKINSVADNLRESSTSLNKASSNLEPFR